MATLNNTIEELPYIAPDEARTKVFETLTNEKEIAKFKNALGMLKQNNQLWLCIAILRYRHNGYISKNNNPFMIDIFRNLVGIAKKPQVIEMASASSPTKEVIKEVEVIMGSTSSPTEEVPVEVEVHKPLTINHKPSFLSRLINKIF